MTQSPSKRGFLARDVALLGVFLAYTLVIGLIERMIPLSFTIPGIKLGLANVAVLMAIYLFSFGKTLLLVLLKCTVIALMSGNLSALLYSLAGSLLSFLVMYALVRLTQGKLSPIGVSVAGSAAHNTGQILVACFLFDTAAMLGYLPVLLIIGTVTGVLIGLLVKRLQPRLLAIWEKNRRTVAADGQKAETPV